MSAESFQYLLNVVGPKIEKKSTNFRKPIPASERLCLTIHYLAYGNSQQSISFSYRVGKSTVSEIVNETYSAIWDSLREIYVKAPGTPEDWRKISQEFESWWNLPHCIGAINRKHIRIKSPLKSRSLYYNYKDYFSIILMAMCDTHYTFTLVDIGSYGSNNDSSVFCNSEIGRCFFEGVIVGDEAFPIQSWVMRPYSDPNIPETMRIFNYRLTRARRVIENTFSILAARWRILLHRIQTSIKTTQLIVQAVVALHNFLRQTNSASYCPTGFVDSHDESGVIKEGEWRSIVRSNGSAGLLEPLNALRGSRIPTSAIETHSNLTTYVNSLQGSVPWQWDYVM